MCCHMRQSVTKLQPWLCSLHEKWLDIKEENAGNGGHDGRHGNSTMGFLRRDTFKLKAAEGINTKSYAPALMRRGDLGGSDRLLLSGLWH